MAKKPIVLIHGWSDSSDSFEPLAERLAKATGQDVSNLWLGDYVSLDDDVKLADISSALQRAWLARGLSVEPNKVDVVIHSTGGLVIRDWMFAYYTSQGMKPPVQNLVMLAPANFGSPLAHKGRSIMGRAVKGIGSGFETGTHILKALEMASPYSWDLAEKDRFRTNQFNSRGVRCTVIVGNSGYPGIRGLANEDGSDGTVYVATASLNCARIQLKVNRFDERPIPGEDTITAGKIQHSLGSTALLVLDKFDHGSIIAKKSKSKATEALVESIVSALQVNAQGFAQWVSDCQDATDALYEEYGKKRDAEKHAFQNTVFRVSDDQGEFVEDYAIEFYGDFDSEKDRWARVFNREISGKTHAYGANCAYRSFMIDISLLTKEIDKANEAFKISISAVPDVMKTGSKVGYKTSESEHIGSITLGPDALREYFAPNRTLLVDIILPRYQQDEVVTLNPLN